MTMNADQVSLLTGNDSSRTNSPSRFNANKWRKNIFLLVVTCLIISCLGVYFYLNIEALNGNNAPDRFKPLSRRRPMLDHESIFSDSGPSMLNLNELLAHCIVALRIAGKQVVNLSLVNNQKLDDVKSKGLTKDGVSEVVTRADMRSHEMIINTIKDSYRRLKIVSEEDDTSGYDDINLKRGVLPIKRDQFAKMLRADLHEVENNNPAKGSMIAQHDTLVWIDPLDATKEYSENLTNYVTLMACIVHKSQPIAGVIYKPFTKQVYWSVADASIQNHHRSKDLELALASSSNNLNTSQTPRIIVSRSHAGNVREALNRVYGSRVDIIPAGGSGFKTIELVYGRADAYVHLTHIKKWDICAPNAIINSIDNAKFTELNGTMISYGDAKAKLVEQGLVASLDGKLHDDIVREFQQL